MSDWVHALADRAGPLAAAARRFASPLPRGGDAIAAIADAIFELAHDPDAPDSADAELIECAGALLGLVLLDRHPGKHTQRDLDHRVLLGSWGSFDPFAAIDAALEAEDPTAAFRKRVALAEAEARGNGPIARVVRAFCKALPEAHEVSGRFDLELRLGEGIEVDLGSVYRATESQGLSAVQRAVEKVAALLDGSRAKPSWPDVRDRLLPRLVGDAFLLSLEDRASGLWLRPLAHDVQIALQVRSEGRVRYVRSDEVETWTQQGGNPFEQALAYLAARSEAARFAQLDTDEGPLVVARTGDGLDAARLLLPSLREVLAPALGDTVHVAIPHRDTLLAAADEELVKRHADDAYRRAPHPISKRAFRLVDLTR